MAVIGHDGYWGAPAAEPPLGRTGLGTASLLFLAVDSICRSCNASLSWGSTRSALSTAARASTNCDSLASVAAKLTHARTERGLAERAERKQASASASCPSWPNNVPRLLAASAKRGM